MTWTAVAGYEGAYEVSDDGQVRSLDRLVRQARDRGERLARGRVLAQCWDGRDGNGYLYVKLSLHGVKRNHHVHSLVLTAFVGPRPPGLHACHGPEGKAVNTVGNLRWDTRSANMLDAVREGSHPEARKTHCKRGHLLAGENLGTNARGARRCRSCGIAHGRVRVYGGDVARVADAIYATLAA